MSTIPSLQAGSLQGLHCVECLAILWYVQPIVRLVLILSLDLLKQAELDWGVGQVLEILKKAGVERNTFVFFTSDNG